METKQHILVRIDKKYREPVKLFRCPSCLQVKEAAFVSPDSGKEFCRDCAVKFERIGTAILSRNGQSSFSEVCVVNDEGESCFISREQKRILTILRSKKIKYRHNIIPLVAEAMQKNSQWVREQIEFIQEYGFHVPNRQERHDAFNKYVLAQTMTLKMSGRVSQQECMKLANAIASETGNSVKLIQAMIMEFMKDMNIQKTKLKSRNSLEVKANAAI
jgi:hypothetical protein